MPPSRSARGIAILSVVTVLVALLLIAIPFVITQKLGRDRTETTSARERAKIEADLVARAVVSYLHQTHPAYEQQRTGPSAEGTLGDDRVDTRAEFTPDPSYRKVIASLMPKGPGGVEASLADPRGSIWSWKVVDQNALVNPNGASPYLVANLLGAADLAEDIDASSSVIAVANAWPAPASGMRAFRAEGGFVRIGNEVIQYARYEAGAFRDCVRGALREGPPLRDNGAAREHKKGERVIDYTAWKVATHGIASRPGSLASFENLEQLRTVGSWGPGGTLEIERFEAIKPFVTVWSRRETVETFLDGQLVVNALPEASAEAVGETVRVRDASYQSGNAAYFGQGTIVRITDGIQTDFQTVMQPGDDKGGQLGSVVTLAGPLLDGHAYEGGRAMIQPLAPYPVNVNTAPREVLAAVLCGLRVRGVDEPKEWVTGEVAWDLAGRIVDSREAAASAAGDDDRRKSGPFRSVRDVGQWLEDLVAAGTIGDRQAEAILTNAVNPRDTRIEYGTASFCFRTLDVYLVEGRAVVNTESGEKAAEAAVRQIVEIGANQATTWTLDSQADFEGALAQGSGGKYVETYPWNVAFVNDANAFVQPRRRAAQMWQRKTWPSEERSEAMGDVRVQAARIGMQNPTFREQMDASHYSDGWYTPESREYAQPTKKYLRTDDAQDLYLHPFTVSFWMRPYAEGEFFLFDTGKQNDQNRVSIFVRDAQGGRELVLRVCDATMEERGAEVFVPLTRLGYKPETWYHLQANVRGCDPAMMELLVDGVSVTRRRGMSWLTAPLGADQDGVPVDDTEGFDAAGAVMIGTEIVEYDQRTADGFSQVVRGARGTQAKDWPQGTAVKTVGYSHALLLDLRRGGAGLEQQNWDRWRFMRVIQTQPEDQCSYTSGASSLQFFGAAEGSTSVTLTLANADPSDTTDVSQNAETFQSKGYALLWCRRLNLSNTTTAPAAGGASGAGFSPSPAAPGWPAARRLGLALLAGAPVQDAPPQPGGGVGPGGRNPSDPPGGGQASGGSLSGATAIGGWEVVWYTRNGTSLTVDRFQSTALHTDSGQAFFMATRVMTPNGEQPWDCFVAPISVLGVPAANTGMDYLDWNREDDKRQLQQYAQDGDPDDGGPDRYDRPRFVVGTSDPAGANEVVCYDSLDRQKASPSILFLRDEEESLSNLAEAFTTRLPDESPASLLPSSTGGGTGDPATPPRTAPGAPPVVNPGGALLAGATMPPPLPGRVFARPEDAVPPSGPGGAVPPGREPPPDESGGGGTQPSPGTGPGGNLPPPGLRPPSDPPPDDTSTPGGTQPGGTQTTLPTVDDLKAVFPFRGVNDTQDRRHPSIASTDPEALILPCFRILRRHEATGLPLNGPHAGFNDVVTLSTGTTEMRREQRRVRWSHGVAGGGRATSWVALTEFLEGESFVPDLGGDVDRPEYRGTTRMLKFPSGEMPDEEGERLVWCKNEVGDGSPVTAFLDEVFLWRHARVVPVGMLANGENMTDEEKEITVRALPPASSMIGVDGYDQDVGVVSIDGELVVYRSTRQDTSDTVTLEDCRRGAFGTVARAHGVGTMVRFVPDVPVSALAGGITREAWSVPLVHTRRWPREGAARIVSDNHVEVVHYSGLSEDGLVMPQALDADTTVRGRGLFRGRYGTEPMDHDNGAIVIFQPVRYWDRAALRIGPDRATFAGIHEHPATSYVTFARTVRDAYWRRVTWSENLDGRLGGAAAGDSAGEAGSRRAPSKMDLLVLARIDQGVPWDTTRVADLRGDRALPPDARDNPERYLYLFDDPDTANRLDLEASIAEFRLLFTYLNGAYVPVDVAENQDDVVLENAWKNTPWLRSFTVEYQNRTRVRYAADVR